MSSMQMTKVNLPPTSTPMWGALLGLGVCSDGEQRAVVTVTAVLRERYETPEGFFHPRYQQHACHTPHAVRHT